MHWSAWLLGAPVVTSLVVGALGVLRALRASDASAEGDATERRRHHARSPYRTFSRITTKPHRPL